VRYHKNMKMSDLVDSNNESYRMREMLKKQLADFRLTNKESDFSISYDFDGGIRVLAVSLKEWNQRLHKSLCDCFGVKLVNMTRTESYTRRVHNTNLMFMYRPVDSLEEELEWSELLW